MKQSSFAEVLIQFLDVSEGGRKWLPQLNTPGYRPHFRVPPSDELLGVEFVDGPDEYRATDRVYATVRFVYEPDVSYRALTVGAHFDIVEGSKVVGHGMVTRRWAKFNSIAGAANTSLQRTALARWSSALLPYDGGPDRHRSAPPLSSAVRPL
jgi:hypothetical protein